MFSFISTLRAGICRGGGSVVIGGARVVARFAPWRFLGFCVCIYNVDDWPLLQIHVRTIISGFCIDFK